MYCNSRSVHNKIEEMINRVTVESPDVVAITETWGDGLRIPGYGEPFVDTRELRSNRRGGGVALFVKKGIPACGKFDMNNHIESCWCEIKFHTGFMVSVGVIYRSTNANIFNISNVDDMILKDVAKIDLLPNCAVVVGDFNARYVNWTTMDSSGAPNSFDTRLLEVCQDNFLVQHVSNPTRFDADGICGNVLDLIFTRNVDAQLISNVVHTDPIGLSDHEVLLFDLSVPFESEVLLTNDPGTRNFYKAKFECMVTQLGAAPWLQVGARDSSPDQCWAEFIKNYDKVVTENVPLRVYNKKVKHPWVSKSTVRAVKRKEAAYRSARNSGAAIDKLVYRRECSKARDAIKEQRKVYEMELLKSSKIIGSTKAVFGYINKYSGNKVKDQINYITKGDGSKSADARVIANEFSNYFSKVLVPDDNLTQIPDMHVDEHGQVLCDMNFSVDDIMVYLENIDIGKAAGPDGCAPIVLKRCRAVLADKLHKIFRRSLDCGMVPASWREAYVCPIFKGGNVRARESVDNYRPVSLTSQVCKLMEKLIRSAIVQYLGENNILRNYQHGFRGGRSCATNLLESLEIITKAVDDGDQVDVAFLDFSKAFDKVNHNILLQKLHDIGIRGKIWFWICSFLTGRTQRVKIRDVCSDSVLVTSGVPQGSVLGPLLFTIYVNSLPDVSPCRLKLFADDTKLLNVHKQPGEENRLQVGLNRLEDWSAMNKLPFNEKKCKVLSFARTMSMNLRRPFSICSEYIDFVASERDLGVVLCSTLDPARHINIIVNKANFALGIARKAFQVKDKNVFLLLFKTLVRPQLEYAVQIWNPWRRKDIEKLEKVQKRATRLVPQCRGLTYADRLRFLGLDTLEERRHRGDMIMTFRIVRGFIDIDRNLLFDTARNTSTRGHRFKLQTRRTNCNIRNHFFSVRVVEPWNRLPSEVVESPNVNVFKSRYDRFRAHERSMMEASPWTT